MSVEIGSYSYTTKPSLSLLTHPRIQEIDFGVSKWTPGDLNRFPNLTKIIIYAHVGGGAPWYPRPKEGSRGSITIVPQDPSMPNIKTLVVKQPHACAYPQSCILRTTWDRFEALERIILDVKNMRRLVRAADRCEHDWGMFWNDIRKQLSRQRFYASHSLEGIPEELPDENIFQRYNPFAMMDRELTRIHNLGIAVLLHEETYTPGQVIFKDTTPKPHAPLTEQRSSLNSFEFRQFLLSRKKIANVEEFKERLRKKKRAAKLNLKPIGSVSLPATAMKWPNRKWEAYWPKPTLGYYTSYSPFV